MNKSELSIILEQHKLWLESDFEDGKKADLCGANLDFSCLPLWCGSLKAHFDDRQIMQFLYHTLSAVQNSKNVSEEVKKLLLTETNVGIANRFHMVKECGKLKKHEGSAEEMQK